MKHYSEYNYLHPAHREARAQAFCPVKCAGAMRAGSERQQSADHWGGPYYKEETDTGAGDDRCTAICFICDQVITEIRRMMSYGGDPFVFLAQVRKGVSECFTKSTSKGFAQACITPVKVVTGTNPDVIARAEIGKRNKQTADFSEIARLDCRTISLARFPTEIPQSRLWRRSGQQ